MSVILSIWCVVSDNWSIMNYEFNHICKILPQQSVEFTSQQYSRATANLDFFKKIYYDVNIHFYKNKVVIIQGGGL